MALVAVVAACATPTPTPTPSPSAALPAPSTLSPTPVPAADLVVEGTVLQGCGSWGGCAYFITIDAPSESWKAEFIRGGQDDQLVGGIGLPATIPSGTYTLTLSSVHVSDDVNNGVRQLESTDATCSTTINVRGDHPVRIQGLFDKGSCEVVVEA